MNRTTRYGIVVGAIASPMLLFAVLPLVFGARGLGPVVGSFLFVLAWITAVFAGRASGRAVDNPTTGKFVRETGFAVLLLVLFVSAILAYGNL